MNNITISNNKRDFVKEAQELGSKATTRKGAIKYLCQHYRRNSNGYRWNLENSMNYGDAIKKRAQRTAHPEASRCRDDKKFRKNYLAKLLREEKRLVKKPGNNVEAAYQRLFWISEERNRITGKWKDVPARTWKTDIEHRYAVKRIAKECDIYTHSVGSDYFEVFVRDYVFGDNLEKYHANGPYLAVVEEERTRTYPKSCDWKSSTRVDVYLVGRNENGNAFAHQISRNIFTVEDAWGWVWRGADIKHRQGDVGLAVSKNLKHVDGNEENVDVLGHSRHRFWGEVYRNGSLHIRNGFLYHEGDQHPTIAVGNKWMRVVPARRSEVGFSSAD